MNPPQTGGPGPSFGPYTGGDRGFEGSYTPQQPLGEPPGSYYRPMPSVTNNVPWADGSYGSNRPLGDRGFEGSFAPQPYSPPAWSNPQLDPSKISALGGNDPYGGSGYLPSPQLNSGYNPYSMWGDNSGYYGDSAMPYGQWR